MERSHISLYCHNTLIGCDFQPLQKRHVLAAEKIYDPPLQVTVSMHLFGRRNRHEANSSVLGPEKVLFRVDAKSRAVRS
jgi:hypothetical protein